MIEKIEFYHHKIIEVRGSFAFDDLGVEITTLGKSRYISYSDIDRIIRGFYSRTTMLGISQANPNLYRIVLSDGKSIDFCVSHREEDAYMSEIRRLRQRIYKTNALGVGLTSKIERNLDIIRQRDIQFEKEKPVRKYSLESAINKLLIKCDLELDDLTEYKAKPKIAKPAAKRNTKKKAANSEDELIELVALLTGNDAEVTGEALTKTENYRQYFAKEQAAQNSAESEAKPSIANICWQEMIAVLERHGYAREISRDEGEKSVQEKITAIKRKMKLNISTDMMLELLDGNETVDRIDTGRILNLIGNNTVEQGYSLADISTESDRYVVCIIPNKAYKKSEELLESIGFSLESF